MMRAPRGLSPAEAELWARVAQTVQPLHPVRVGKPSKPAEPQHPSVPATLKVLRAVPFQPSLSVQPVAPAARPRPLDRHGLDASWERKLAKAALQPDFTLDLHGHSLDQAHDRLDHGLSLAVVQGARLVLVITGRPRPVDAADRGTRRGAIRAKLLDWLAAGPHASRIAAVRPAHQKHGGAGAVYVVLSRLR